MSAVRNKTTSLVQVRVHTGSNVFGCLVHVTKKNAKSNKETAHQDAWLANSQKCIFAQNGLALSNRAIVFGNVIREGSILTIGQ